MSAESVSGWGGLFERGVKQAGVQLP